MPKKLLSKKIIYFVIIGFFSIFSVALASSLDLTSQSLTYRVGDMIRARIIVKSDTSINAVSSKVIFPKDILSLSSISKNGSIISLWAQEPKISNDIGNANLEGVILNGYIGNSGMVATLIFKANKEGEAVVKLSDASILANDGDGTNVLSGEMPSLFLKIDKALDVPRDDQNKPVIQKPEEIKTEKPDDSKITEVAEKVTEKVNEVEITNSLPNNSLLITIIILLLIIIVFAIIFIILLLLKIRRYINRKLKKTEIVIDNNFKNLEQDINSRIEHNSKESGKIIREDVEINDEIEKTKGEIIKEIINIEKEL